MPVVTLLHRPKYSLLKQVNESTQKKHGLHLDIQIRSWTQNKTLAVSFPMKYSSLEKGFGGFFAVFCNMRVHLNLGSFQNLYKEGMHGPYKWLPSSTSAQDRRVMMSGSSSRRTEVLYNTMGVLAGWLFGAEKQSLACPILCSNFDKNMFLITGSQRRICPWEWQKLQLEEGSDRIRGRTKRSGFHLCAVALSGLKYKKQFCYGRFLECPWQKLTEAYGSAMEVPSVL